MGSVGTTERPGPGDEVAWRAWCSPLATLASLGLPRAPNMGVTRYLDELVALDALPAEAADGYRRAYLRARFGGAKPQEAALPQACDRLAAAVDALRRDAPRLEAAREGWEKACARARSAPPPRRAGGDAGRELSPGPPEGPGGSRTRGRLRTAAVVAAGVGALAWILAAWQAGQPPDPSPASVRSRPPPLRGPGDQGGTTAPDGLTAPWQHHAAGVAFGLAHVDTRWRRIALKTPQHQPVVVATVRSLRDPQPVTVALRAVAPDGFEMRLQHWEYQDGRHANEEVSWLALDAEAPPSPARPALARSTHVEPSHFVAGGQAPRPLRVPLPVAPDSVVLAALQSTESGRVLAVRIVEVGDGHVDLLLEGQEGSAAPPRGETVGLVALTETRGWLGGRAFRAARGEALDSRWSAPSPACLDSASLRFVQPLSRAGVDPILVRQRTAPSGHFEVRIVEDQALTRETFHLSPERYGWLQVESSPGVCDGE